MLCVEVCCCLLLLPLLLLLLLFAVDVRYFTVVSSAVAVDGLLCRVAPSCCC